MTLLPGDVLLWRIAPGAPLIDRLIGWGERRLGQSRGADYYHVGFVGRDPMRFYQAKPPWTCLSLVPAVLPPYLEVFRLKSTPSSDQLEAVFVYGDYRLGKLYDFLGVLTGGFFEAGGLEFCSKFTNDAFSHAGIVLAPAETLISPDDIAASPLLARMMI